MTATLYAIDGEANQRLIDQERERRTDLIETAVSSFAPHLRGSVGLQVIHLYCTNAALRKAVRTAFEGSRTIVVEHVPDAGKDRKGVNEVKYEGTYIPLPKTADLVLTKSNLNFKTELLAAQLGALPPCTARRSGLSLQAA